MKRIAWILAATALLVGCGDEESPTDPVDESFRVTVTVVDAEGAPLEGVNVGMSNELLVTPDVAAAAASIPGVTVPVELTGSAIVRIVARNMADEVVRNVTSEVLPGGQRNVHWDGFDGEGEPAPSGRYSLSVLFYEPQGSEPVFTATQDVFLERPAGTHALGVTDAEGVFEVDDVNMFPSFYSLAYMVATDATGAVTGTVREVDGAIVSVWLDGQAVASESVAIEYGPNEVTVVYDPTLSTLQEPLVVVPDPLVDKADQPEWGVGPAFPNPFH